VSCGFTIGQSTVYQSATQIVYDPSSGEYIEQPTYTTILEDINPSDMFITYGVEFTEKGLRFYINGHNFLTYALDDYDDGTLLQMRPKYLLLSAGEISGGGGLPCTVLCPSQMEVDYVRAYLPETRKAVDWLENRTVVCKNGTVDVACSYYPDVIYTWTSDAFDISEIWQGVSTARRISPKPNTVPGVYHTLTLTSTFPDGHSEVLTRSLYVGNDNAISPPIELSVTCQELYCAASIIESGSCGCALPNVYEWSTDGGVTWSNFGTYYAFPNPSNPLQRPEKLCVRTSNCHGVSTKRLCVDIPYDSPTQERSSTNSPESLIYPNPVKDVLYLPSSDDADAIISKLMVLDILGNIVHSAQNSTSSTINVAALPSGAYFLLMEREGASGQSYKFIKL
jgi:hypothetical protein